jgi:hypothetical protein
MKKYVLALALLLVYFSNDAQTMKNNEELSKRIAAIEDKIALKELVDNFSILADKKEVETQVLLFTENATLETSLTGTPGSSKLTGRKELAVAFAPFLANFQTVYHFNGQHAVILNGDKAAGTLYCWVTLIGLENGKKMKTTIGVFYSDEYVRENGKWLISKRKATFDWQDKQQLGK